MWPERAGLSIRAPDKKRRSRTSATPPDCPCRGGRRLLDLEQLDFEDQCRVGRDDAGGASRAVAEIGRDQEHALASDLHRCNALVPALDHAPLADRERERRAAIERAVEPLALGAVFPEPAGVVHDAGLALLRRRAGADLRVLVL